MTEDIKRGYFAELVGGERGQRSHRHAGNLTSIFVLDCCHQSGATPKSGGQHIELWGRTEVVVAYVK